MKTRLTASILCFLLSCCVLSAQRITRDEYIATYKETAVRAMKTHGIPASITLAQGCLESADGNSDLARQANNHFGIKCHRDWTGPTYRKKDDDPGKSCFRKYRNAEESFRDHSDFLRYRDRYAFLFDLEITDYKGWCYGLKKAGYATAPDYAQKLIRIIEEYRLYEYDRKVKDQDSRSRIVKVLPPSPAQLTAVEIYTPVRSSPLYNVSQSRIIYVKNKVPYIVAGDSETYGKIAREYNLFRSELLRYNDLRKEIPIAPGTVVYLQKKRNKAQRHMEIHIAVEGDTYYKISQKYGVRLKKLLEYNRRKADDILHIGDEVFLRRHRTY